MNRVELTAVLKAEALRLGFDLAGATPAVASPDFDRLRQWLAEDYAGQIGCFADRLDAYCHPDRVLEGAKSLLVLGMNYRTVEPVNTNPGQAVVSRYAWGADYHEVIRRRLHELADFHRRLVPAASVRGVVDTAPLLERQFARLAGLGWIGKNTTLINKRFGSWLFLAVLLTTEELEYDRPGDAHCGSCRACLDACPTGALFEPYRLDARKCISYLTIELQGDIPCEFRAKCSNRLFGCDACQQACPWNLRTSVGVEPAFLPGPGMNPVDVNELAALDEAAFRRRFRHTPLWRAKRKGILRNVAVVRENASEM